MPDNCTEDRAIVQIPGPPNFWAGLNDSSPAEAVKAADGLCDAWFHSDAGSTFIEWDRRVGVFAGAHKMSFSAAMKALNVSFV